MNIDLNGNTLTGNVSYTNLIAAGVVTLSTSIPGGKVDGTLTVNTPVADFVVGTGVTVTGLTTITDVASSTFINNGTLSAVQINDANGTRFVNNNTVGPITLGDNVNATLVGNFGTINTGVGSTINFETGSTAKDIDSTTAAVVKAEVSKLQDDVNTARELVEALADGDNKTALLARLEAVTAPVISNINYKSTTNVDNDNSILTATNGDIITLTFTSSQPVTKLNSFKINGSNPDSFTNVGNVYTATHLVDSGDVEGDATFQISVQNAKGVYSKTIEKTTDGSSVTITHRDTTPPIVMGITNGTTYGSSGVTPSFTEGTATLNGVAFTSGTLLTAHGNYTLVVTDQAGNSTVLNFTIDAIAPKVISVDIRDGGNNSPAHYFTNVNDTVRITFSKPMNITKQSSITVASIDELFDIDTYDSDQNFASKTVEIQFESSTSLLLTIKEVPNTFGNTFGVLEGDIMTIENINAVKDILVDIAGNSLAGIQNGTLTVGTFQ